MGHVTNEGARRHRQLLGLRRKPGRLAVTVFRMPLLAYRHDAGWVLGRTVVEFNHTGRRTGQPHDAIAIVLHYDESAREAVIFSGWGPNADWVRNLHIRPALRVQIGRESFVPEQRFLTGGFRCRR